MSHFAESQRRLTKGAVNAHPQCVHLVCEARCGLSALGLEGNTASNPLEQSFRPRRHQRLPLCRLIAIHLS